MQFWFYTALKHPFTTWDFCHFWDPFVPDGNDVQPFFCSTRPIWLCLNDADVKSVFQTTEGYTPLWANWGPACLGETAGNEPEKQDCVKRRDNGEWADNDWTVLHWFFCEGKNWRVRSSIKLINTVLQWITYGKSESNSIANKTYSKKYNVTIRKRLKSQFIVWKITKKLNFSESFFVIELNELSIVSISFLLCSAQSIIF